MRILKKKKKRRRTSAFLLEVKLNIAARIEATTRRKTAVYSPRTQVSIQRVRTIRVERDRSRSGRDAETKKQKQADRGAPSIKVFQIDLVAPEGI